MKCKKCVYKLFTIQIIPCCDDCDQNMAWDDFKYTDDMKVIAEKELIRDQVENDGECKFGSAFGAGCYMFRCNNCGNKTNLPLLEGC